MSHINKEVPQTFAAIRLDPSTGDPGHNEGTIFYDNVNKALGFYNDEADSVAQIPYESWFRGRNTGTLIPNGSAVYQGPVDSGIPTLLLGKADAVATSETLVGLTTHSIENATTGIVVTRGTLRGYDTQTPGWTSGDPLWLSGTVAGGLTNVRPGLPYRAIRVGVVGIVDSVNGTIEVRAGWPQTQSATEIIFPNDGVSTHADTLAEAIDHMWSASSLNGFDLTEPGTPDGTVNIAAGDIVLRSTDSHDSPLITYNIGAVAGISPTNESSTIIYASYNGGSPTILNTLDPTTIDGRTEVPLWMVTRISTTVVHYVDLREYSSDSMYKLAKESFYVNGFQHARGGSVLTETGTRNLNVTAGSFYIVGKEQTHSVFDTSVASTFTSAYYNGSAWIRTPGQTQIDNTQYNNVATGLVALSNNKFGVHWVFVILNNPSELYVLYGVGDYSTLSEAQSAQIPPSLPPELSQYSTGQLIGKVIIEKSASIFADIQTPFEYQLTSAVATAHNSLGGLQGGTLLEYYHFTSAQHTDLTDAGDSTLHYHATDRARANHTGTLTKTQYDATASDGDFAWATGAYHDGFSDFVADEHVAHSGVTLTAGEGLTGGGDISASRSFALDFNDLSVADTTITSTDLLSIYDGAQKKITWENVQLSISITSSQVSDFNASINAVDVNQVAHTLTAGDVIYNNAGTWTKAKADLPSTLGVAIVIDVAGVDDFTYTTVGNVTLTAHGYTVGQYLYVSEVTAGLLTQTEPTGIADFSNPVCYVLDANTLLMFPWRPYNAIPRSNDLQIISTTSASYDVLDTDEVVLVDATTGNKIVNLPTPSADYGGFTARIKKVDSSANTVTIKCASGNIDGTIGTTGEIITVQNDSRTCSCDATDYWLL